MVKTLMIVETKKNNRYKIKGKGDLPQEVHFLRLVLSLLDDHHEHNLRYTVLIVP